MDDESDVIRGNVETTRTLVWDLTNLEDPILVKEFMGSMPASAHNQYVKDNFVYQANYRYGLHVLDISDPVNPREVGFFDTSPYQTGPGFSGAWSTYPFFESGTVIVTSLQEGLFILKKRGPATN
jgi:choice-of-anchor B domain-containing protein